MTRSAIISHCAVLTWRQSPSFPVLCFPTLGLRQPWPGHWQLPELPCCSLSSSSVSSPKNNPLTINTDRRELPLYYFLLWFIHSFSFSPVGFSWSPSWPGQLPGAWRGNAEFTFVYDWVTRYAPYGPYFGREEEEGEKKGRPEMILV